MTAPTVGVLALQGDVREHSAALQASGAHVRRVRSAADLGHIDGVVIPGGESTTIAKLAVDLGVFEPLKAAIVDGLPTYGSCAGLVFVATEVLDGITDQPSLGVVDISVRRNAFGRQVASFEQDIDFPAIGSKPFHGVFIRAPWVERIGPHVEVLASVTDQESTDRIVACRQGRVLATSFHPELTDDIRIHSLFVDMVKGN